jgi:hypothetical protein
VGEIWRSQVWFPFLVAGAVVAAAWAGSRLGLPAARVRSRVDVVTGAALVLGLYALTAVVDGEPPTVSVVLCGAIAVAIWPWWDLPAGSLGVALSAAVLGPLAEIVLVAVGAASYGDDALFGVAPWLPCLYFGAGAVASGLWAATSTAAGRGRRRRRSRLLQAVLPYCRPATPRQDAFAEISAAAGPPLPDPAQCLATRS